MENITAYPLTWPFGWKRTRYPERSRFSDKYFSTVRDFLLKEVDKLGGTEIVLSTNIELRQDGLPYANRRQPDDRGIAVYFKLNKKDVSLACDKWIKIEHNIYAIAMHIDALRAQDRWGVGTLEQAFMGYTTLPEKTGKDYFENIQPYFRKRHYHRMAKLLHPDKTGSDVEFKELNSQYKKLTEEKNHE